MDRHHTSGGARGFALLDAVLALALACGFALAFASAFGGRASDAHATALALEAALADARALARANAAGDDPASATGATLVIEPDPALPTDPAATRIALYRARPIVVAGARGATTPAAPGIPPAHVRGRIAYVANGVTIGAPFAILLAGSGPASVVPLRAAYDPEHPPAFALDPGCVAGGRLQIDDGRAQEAHPFDCTAGRYAAN